MSQSAIWFEKQRRGRMLKSKEENGASYLLGIGDKLKADLNLILLSYDFNYRFHSGPGTLNNSQNFSELLRTPQNYS